jgi:hypothetical protein
MRNYFHEENVARGFTLRWRIPWKLSVGTGMTADYRGERAVWKEKGGQALQLPAGGAD